MKRVKVIGALAFCLAGCNAGVNSIGAGKPAPAGTYSGTSNLAKQDKKGTAELVIADEGKTTGTIHLDDPKTDLKLDGKIFGAEFNGTLEGGPEPKAKFRGSAIVRENGHIDGKVSMRGPDRKPITYEFSLDPK